MWRVRDTVRSLAKSSQRQHPAAGPLDGPQSLAGTPFLFSLVLPWDGQFCSTTHPLPHTPTLNMDQKPFTQLCPPNRFFFPLLYVNSLRHFVTVRETWCPREAYCIIQSSEKDVSAILNWYPGVDRTQQSDLWVFLDHISHGSERGFFHTAIGKKPLSTGGWKGWEKRK